MALTHKEMTAHIRKRLKVAGVKARVRMQDFNGHRMIQVSTPAYDKRFSSAQLDQLATIVMANGLTLIRGAKIDPEVLVQLTGSTDFNFEFHGRA